MWIPLSIRFTNLFSHGETEFHFKRNEMQLLLGENKDEEGANSNGAGKSTIIESISLALNGTVYRDINKDQFIRTGQESCLVSFELKNSITNDVLHIYREFWAGTKTSVLNLKINGKPLKEFDSKNKLKRSAQDYIYELIGIDRENILNHFIIGQGNENSFFDSTDTKQKEVISRFSNYNKIDKIVEKIKEDIKEAEQDTYRISGSLESKESSRYDLLQIISELESSDEYEENKKQLQEELESLLQRVANGTEKINNLERTVVSSKQAIAVLKKELNVKDDINTLNKKLRETKTLRDSQEEVLNDLKEIKGQLAIRTGKIIACPKCSFQFIPNDDMTAKEVKESKEYTENEIKIANDNLIKHNALIEKYKKQIQKIEKIQEDQNTLDNRVLRLNELREQEKEILEKLISKKSEIKNLQKGINKKLIQEQKDKLTVLENQIKNLEKEQDDLVMKKESLQFHRFSFEKQFKTYICNKTIKTIQDLTNFYLQRFKISMRVLISGYSILKSGELRDKMQIWVIKEGNQKVLFKSLSGGEKSRIALCGIISLQKLINNACENNGGFDLLAIDEFLQGLDESGIKEVLQILEESKLTSLLVLHHVGQIYVKNRVVITKENGISKILKNGQRNIA